MTGWLATIRRFLRNQSAATAVEYAVMLMLVLAVVIGSITVVGSSTRQTFDETSADISQAVGE
jgi:pilus assembly protein Flp/PilA